MAVESEPLRCLTTLLRKLTSGACPSLLTEPKCAPVPVVNMKKQGSVALDDGCVVTGGLSLCRVSWRGGLRLERDKNERLLTLSMPEMGSGHVAVGPRGRDGIASGERKSVFLTLIVAFQLTSECKARTVLQAALEQQFHR